MAYGTINADQIGTSVANTSLGAGNASIMKNRIINGAMVIDQRNAGASVTPSTGSTYTLDRWFTQNSVASKFTVQQNAGSVTPPVGFTNYAGITSSSAYSVSSSDYFLFQQRIEGYNIADLGWGTVNAKTVTLSFWVYSSLTGTFGGALESASGTRNYPFTYTISSANTWTQISVTVAGDGVAGAGSWLTTNGVGMQVTFGLGVGSTYSGTAGAWTSSLVFAPTGSVSVVGTNGATWYITGVQLEVGSSATGYEYVNYQTSLANCQRYYINFGGNEMFLTFYDGNTSTRVAGNLGFPTTMRTNPTMSYSTNALGSLVGSTVTVTGASYIYNGSSSRNGNTELSNMTASAEL